MCGIVFAVGPNRETGSGPVRAFVDKVNVIQHHRGPDAQGVMLEAFGASEVGFAHQRLAILDLTDAGRQPMSSRSGRLSIVFNGEIYNYRELIAEYGLTGLVSGSDTEVIVELIEKLGIEEACKQLNGMWALAVLDRKAGKVYLSRDRFGKKPLNTSVRNGIFYGASEIKSFHAVEGVTWKPDTLTAARFLSQSLQNIDEHTWLEGVRAFPAGHVGEIDLVDPGVGIQALRPFWEATLEETNPDRTEADYFDEVRETVIDAIRLRLHADVPVGIALSGGIDSSIIAAVTHRLQGNGTTLFAATNPGMKNDESAFIDLMAKHLNTDVRKYSLAAREDDDLYGILKTCISFNDGPLPSFSNLLFYKLMQIANQIGITVILTGQGADEAFCGYRKYPVFEMKRLLKSGRLGAAARFASGFITRGTLIQQLSFVEGKRYLGHTNNGLLGEAIAEAYQPEPLRQSRETITHHQLADLMQYSVPYLCHYEDRMSMAWSREVRAPFLDYRVVELGLQMPTALKMQRGWTKYALRAAFKDLMPAPITWRKDKQGFINPQDDWLKNRLKVPLLEMMSDPSASVYTHGLVDREAYLATFDKYCKGSKTIWFRDVFAPFSLNLWLTSMAEQT